jgi:hypothetical protein
VGSPKFLQVAPEESGPDPKTPTLAPGKVGGKRNGQVQGLRSNIAAQRRCVERVSIPPKRPPAILRNHRRRQRTLTAHKTHTKQHTPLGWAQGEKRQQAAACAAATPDQHL